MKIDNLTETMFAQAVALAQNGRMKSTIHCGGNHVYIQNMDSTLLFKFKARMDFVDSFSFFANDYESPYIEVKNQQVIFTKNQGNVQRVKTCQAPKMGLIDVLNIFSKHQPIKTHSVAINNNMVSLLEDGLSHVELVKKPNNPFKLRQKDIYSGVSVEIQGASNSLLADLDVDVSFETIGIRTADFQALFTLVDDLTFYIQPEKNWIYFEDKDGIFSGILATCVYDELGSLAKTEGGNHGRQE